MSALEQVIALCRKELRQNMGRITEDPIGSFSLGVSLAVSILTT
jgi:hypothetical protein